jgi:hypothetical protein
LFALLREGGFAARVQGAFREKAGWTSSAIGVVRRAAVALNLIPRTMRGKAALKRIFYGRLQTVPPLAGTSSVSPRLEELGTAGSRHHRVLYATGQKSI